MRRATRSLLTAVALILTLLAALVATSAPASAQETVTRVRGDDRISTAVAVAREGWTRAPHVLLATSGDYPDAVAASAFAAAVDAPVLLTPPGSLPAAVRDALVDLGVEQVTILGGTSAVSGDVQRTIAELGYKVDRLRGASRWATAARLADEVAQRGAIDVVAIALGDRSDDHDAWPDALAAASLAGLRSPIPTLLTRRDGLPQETKDALRDLGPSKVLVLGGDFAIAEAVVDQLRSLGFAVERLDGKNRYATSVAVASEAISGGDASHGELEATEVIVVSGQGFADALGAGALAARRQAPLLLVPAGRLADSVDAFVRHDATNFASAVVVGGAKAVTDFVIDELSAAMAGEPRPAPPCPPNSSPDCAYTYRHPISTWENLAECESHQNWALNTGNGYYGGLQFSHGTWQNVGGQGYAHQNSKWEQIHRGEILQQQSGWGQWPHCSRELGLR